MADDAGSVSLWLAELKAGEVRALEPLWERYFRRLVALARARLGDAGRGSEQDVALDALDSLCRGARGGRYPKLDDRDDLWRLLACIASRKAAAMRRRDGRLKRGGDQVVGDSQELSDALAREPSPEDCALLADESRRLLAALPDDDLRRLATWKMEGWTNAEIAERVGCVPRTVERKLGLIRAAWAAAS